MARVEGLGGRRALTASRRRGVALVALLCLMLGVAELQHVADYATLSYIEDWAPFRAGFGRAVFNVTVVVACLSPVMAGVLVDRYGVWRVISLTALGWCAFVSIGAAVTSPAGFGLGGPLADTLVPEFILCAVLVALVRAFDPRRRGLAGAVVLTLYFFTRERPHVLARLLRHAAAGWPDAMFFLVACGALLAAVWLLAVREPVLRTSARPDSRPAPSLPLRDLGVALALVFWLEVVFAVIPVSRLDLDTLLRGAPAFQAAAGLAAPVTFIVAAYATDRFARRLGTPPASRRFALIPAFLAAALVGLSRAQPEPAGALPLVAAVTAGLLRTVELLTLDRAPRQAPGLYVGLVLMGRIVVINYVGPLLRPTIPAGVVLGVAGVAGAATAAVLLRPRSSG